MAVQNSKNKGHAAQNEMSASAYQYDIKIC